MLENNEIENIIEEKQNYIKKVLKIISNVNENAVFRGGTALSLTYGCIKRFSEDIDLHLIGAKKDQKRQVKNFIENVIEELRKEAWIKNEPHHWKMECFKYNEDNKIIKIKDENSYDGNKRKYTQLEIFFKKKENKKVEGFVEDRIIIEFPPNFRTKEEQNYAEKQKPFKDADFEMLVMKKEFIFYDKCSLILEKFMINGGGIDWIIQDRSDARHIYDILMLHNKYKFNFEKEYIKKRIEYNIFNKTKGIFRGKEGTEKPKNLENFSEYGVETAWKKFKENLMQKRKEIIKKINSIVYPNSKKFIFKDFVKIYENIFKQIFREIRIMKKDLEKNSHLFNFNKGFALGNLGKFKEAIKFFEKALEIDSKHIKSLKGQADALNKLGKREKAIECYDKALEFNSRDEKSLVNKGIILYELGKYSQAIECYDKVLEIDRRNIKALNNKGNTLGNLGKCKEAIEWFDKALEVDSNFIIALENKAISLFKLAKFEDGFECYDKIIENYNKTLEVDPRDVGALVNKGNTLIYLSEKEDEFFYYERFMNFDLRFIDSVYNTGNYSRNLDIYNKAIECYDKALEIEPKNIVILLNKKLILNKKGFAFGNLGKYKKAIDSFNKALEIDPKDVDILENKKISFSKLGYKFSQNQKYKKAIECYDKALEIEPKDVETLWKKGNALNNLEKYKKAIECYDKALEIDPEHLELLINKIKSLNGLGNFKEAIKFCDKVLKIDPRDVNALKNKRNSLRKLGREQEARECEEKINNFIKLK